MRPSMDRNLMSRPTSPPSQLWVLHNIRPNVKQGRLLIRRIQEIIQLSTESCWAIIISQSPNTQRTNCQILVDTVGFGPITGGGRDGFRVLGIAPGGEGDDGPGGDRGEVELCEPLLHEWGVGGGGFVLGWVSPDEGATEGGEGDEGGGGAGAGGGGGGGG